MKRTLLILTTAFVACTNPTLPDGETLLANNNELMHLTATSTYKGVDDQLFAQQLIGDGVDLHLLENDFAVVEWEGSEGDENTLSSATWEKAGESIIIHLDGSDIHFEPTSLHSSSDVNANIVEGFTWTSSNTPSALDNLSFFDEEKLNLSMGSGLTKSR